MLGNGFIKEVVELKMNSYNIVYFVIYFVFIIGYLEEFFILFGDGVFVILWDVENWNL